MAETETSHPDTDYERSDADVRVIGAVAGVILLLVAVLPILLAWLYAPSTTDRDRRMRIVPPEPRLQTDPHAELTAFRAREDSILDSYGWVDRDKKIVRIPIAEAMRKLAEKGIPDWPAPTPPEPKK